MIVVGVDAHKASLTAAAVIEATGVRVAAVTVVARVEGFERLLGWGRSLGGERVWAIEDVRHVSGRLERFLVAHGERVARVTPRLTAGARVGGRERGKSDPIDAAAVAGAAIRAGVERLPTARLDPRALEIRLLVDHRDDLVNGRTRAQNRLRWQLHDLDPAFAVPARGLDRRRQWQRVRVQLDGVAGVRARIALELVDDIERDSGRIQALERELAALVAGYAPQLLAEPGCGALTAAKLIGEIASADRFRTDAQLARAAGVAPIPASSGATHRHRLDRGGNRQLNCALHRLAVNKALWDPATAAYLARRQAAGKTRKDALRCLKRHLARHVWQLLRAPSLKAQPPAAIHCNLPTTNLSLT